MFRISALLKAESPGALGRGSPRSHPLFYVKETARVRWSFSGTHGTYGFPAALCFPKKDCNGEWNRNLYKSYVKVDVPLSQSF